MAEANKETEMSKDVQHETTQVAAVAAAMLEDAQFGKAFSRALTDPGSGIYDQQGALVTQQIRHEREAQDQKWGLQHHNFLEWMMILLEEVGELAELVEVSEFEPEDEESKFGYHILDSMISIGKEARVWCESHDWPERQQKVYDAAKI